MSLIDASSMKPQLEEDIEELRWCTPEEAATLLSDSYSSIRRVQSKYEKMLKNMVSAAAV